MKKQLAILALVSLFSCSKKDDLQQTKEITKTENRFINGDQPVHYVTLATVILKSTKDFSINFTWTSEIVAGGSGVYTISDIRTNVTGGGFNSTWNPTIISYHVDNGKITFTIKGRQSFQVITRLQAVITATDIIDAVLVYDTVTNTWTKKDFIRTDGGFF